MAYLAIKLKQQRDFQIACKVVLLPEKRYYVPGDYIQGKLIVSHRKEGMKLRGIKVCLQGSSYAKFKEREQMHHKSETFLDEGAYVFGGATARVMSHLPPGTHSYPFQLQIPLSPQLPSTHKTNIGLVIYQVLAIVDIGAQNLKKGEKTIDVRGTLEIGPEPPIEFEKVERGSGGEGAPSTRFLFKVPTSGFVIGRDLEFEMRADNCPIEGKLRGIVSLVLKVTYYGGTVSRAWKDTFKVVNEIVNNDVGRHWIGALPVGRQLAATFTGGVVEFRYLLRASLESVKEGTVFKCEKSVKIGTSMVGEVNTLDDKFSELALGAGAAGGRRSPVPFDLESLDGRPGTSGSLPSYSTLSLRTGSFETLPPEYDEIQHSHSVLHEQNSD